MSVWYYDTLGGFSQRVRVSRDLKYVRKTPRPWPAVMPVLPYTRQIIHTRDFGGVFNQTHSFYGPQNDQYYTLYTLIRDEVVDKWSDLWPEDLKSQLIAKFSDANAFSASLAILERKDTFSLITFRCKQIASSFRALKKGKFTRAAKVLDIRLSQRSRKRLRRDSLTLSEQWLEYRYGWVPALSDIESAYGIIRDGFENKGAGILKVHTSRSEHYSGIPSFTWQGPNDSIYGTYVMRKRRGIGINYSVVDPLTLQRNALQLTDVKSIVWELVPFSFIADWFVPVGDYLESLQAFDGCKFIDGYQYELHDYKSKVHACDLQVGSQSRNCTDLQYRNHDMSFERRKISSFDDLQVNPFQVGNGLNLKRAADAVALVQSIFIGDTRPRGRL